MADIAGASHQTLKLSFELSSQRKGTVFASVKPNTDPDNYGLNLALPNVIPKSTPISECKDFPICSATVQSSGSRGYGAMYGWVQLVRCGEPTLQDADEWEMDPIPITADLNTPFAWFGVEPSLFDAPFRTRDRQVDWICRSFLTGIGDCVVSKDVSPILGFEWGFLLRDGKVTIKTLHEIDISTWDEHLELFRRMYVGWTFNSANHNGIK